MPAVKEMEIDFDQQDEVAGPLAPDVTDADADRDRKLLEQDIAVRREKERYNGNKAEEKAEETPSEPEKSPEDVLKELGLKNEVKKRVLSVGNPEEKNTYQEVEYTQKPLSFIGKIQFLSYVGEVLDKAMSGDNALRLGSLFEGPGLRGSQLSTADLSDAQTFIQAIGKLLQYAPDFLVKCYLIWLQVPEFEREWATIAITENLSDEEGLDILETFIDQNWDTLQDFFTNRLGKLSQRVSARYRLTQSAQ